MTPPKKAMRAKRQVVVVELDVASTTRNPQKPHLYVVSTAKTPEKFFESLIAEGAPSWLPGKPVRLRQNLVLNYKPSRSAKAIDRRLVETKTRLARLGHAINGVESVWSLYVLDVNPDVEPPLKNRGKRNHVVYVGQTSKPIDIRLKEHRGDQCGKNNKYLGAPSVRGRDPRLNRRLTPKKKLFTEKDAIKHEAKLAHKLKAAEYRVLGDGLTDPSKRTRTSKR